MEREHSPDAYLRIEASGIRHGQPTRLYTMGLWSSDSARFPRESVLNQKDDVGDVATDTLILRDPCDELQVRLILGGDNAQHPDLKFLGLCLTDNRVMPPDLAPNQSAWDQLIPYPSDHKWLIQMER